MADIHYEFEEIFAILRRSPSINSLSLKQKNMIFGAHLPFLGTFGNQIENMTKMPFLDITLKFPLVTSGLK